MPGYEHLLRNIAHSQDLALGDKLEMARQGSTFHAEALAEQYGVVNRTLGILQAAGGGATAGTGAALILAPGGRLAPLGYVLMFYGIDTTVAGVVQAWTGQSQPTVSHDLLRLAAGSEDVADRGVVAADIATCFVAPQAAVGKIPAVVDHAADALHLAATGSREFSLATSGHLRGGGPPSGLPETVALFGWDEYQGLCQPEEPPDGDSGAR